MKYMVEFFDEQHGNFDGYEVDSDNYEEVEAEAKRDCGEYAWFEITPIKEKG